MQKVTQQVGQVSQPKPRCSVYKLWQNYKLLLLLHDLYSANFENRVGGAEDRVVKRKAYI